MLYIVRCMIGFILVILNLRGFCAFAADKHAAVYGMARTREDALMSSAMTGGIGAWAAMILFHHKTRKGAFPVAVPFFGVAHFILLCLMFYPG